MYVCVCVCVCVCVFILSISPILLLLTYYLSLLRLLFYFDVAFTYFIENTKIQTTENSEKENSGMKQETRKKTELNKDKIKL